MPRIKCAAFSIEPVTLSKAKGPVHSCFAVTPATVPGSPFADPLTS